MRASATPSTAPPTTMAPRRPRTNSAPAASASTTVYSASQIHMSLRVRPRRRPLTHTPVIRRYAVATPHRSSSPAPPTTNCQTLSRNEIEESRSKTVSPRQASYHHGVTTRRANRSRSACRVASCAAAAARSVDSSSLSMSESLPRGFPLRQETARGFPAGRRMVECPGHTRRQWRKPGAIPARSRHCDRGVRSQAKATVPSGVGRPGPDGDPGARRLPPSPLPPLGVDTRGEDACHAWSDRMTYPFGAVVGMDDMRLALLLNAVSPAVGGVLVRGEKGTAKSTTVRALAAVLPPVDVVPGCRFACDPAVPDPACPDGPHDAGAPALTRPARLVELPVGASEDRVVGSLDLERALTEGVKAFEPGLLAAAHRGLLYVDEVNLLHDHLVDLLLDAAALGTAYVEREGISVRHAARFLLVGTMNPEEGELRPQLLDRFGLTVEVAAPRDPAERAEVVRRRFAYDADPSRFAASWAVEEAALAARIAEARVRLPHVVLSDDALRQVTAVCAAFDVDGLRADLVTARAAIAHAAWSGRDEVTEEDVRVAARLALPHRRRRNPFDAPGLDEDTLDRALEDNRPEEPTDPDDDPDDGGGSPPGGGVAPPADAGKGTNTCGSDADPQVKEPMPDEGGHSAQAPAPERAAVAPGEPFRARRLEVPGIGAGAAGRRSRARSQRGRVVGSARPAGPGTELHLA